MSELKVTEIVYSWSLTYDGLNCDFLTYDGVKAMHIR